MTAHALLWSRGDLRARGSALVVLIGRDYRAPIADHADERRRAIERYRAVG